MLFLSYLYTLVIGPIEQIFEIVFAYMNRFSKNPGVSVVALSLCFSILVLPLYRRADKIQEETREREERLSPVIKHIKKQFKGDERFMILQTYYRQNNYSPLSVLAGSVSLILQIPFFIAAYRMLSTCTLLDGASFGPIKDLGRPDAMFSVGGVAINVLPILMTLINIVSGMVYGKKMPMKTKIQLWVMAALFLVLLYASPSGMVLYWTCNNIFALIKNIVVRIAGNFKEKSDKAVKEQVKERKGARATFVLSAAGLAVLSGLYLTSAVMAQSPREFINGESTMMVSPALYLTTPALMGIGMCLLWPSVFYAMASGRGKNIISGAMFSLLLVAAVDSQFFGKDYGTMSNVLVYEKTPNFGGKTRIINLLIVVGVLAVGFVLARFAGGLVRVVAAVSCVTLLVMGCVNVVKINESYSAVESLCDDRLPEFTLSREGKNVVVIMLDRAIGPYAPYIFNEKPELLEAFDGFTYYSNTVSFGSNTNFSAPSLYGGYDYTPDMLNERDDMLLVDKHDEALKVLPTIFSEEGYSCTVVNPSLAGYSYFPDLSIFDDIENTEAYNTLFKYSPFVFGESYEYTIKHNLYCYSLFRCAPVALQRMLYNNGLYNETSEDDSMYAQQVATDRSNAYGWDSLNISEYYTLDAIESMTQIDDGDSCNYLVFASKLAHDPALLQEPEYVPAEVVDNTEFDAANEDRFTVDGRFMDTGNYLMMEHYHVNMASYLLLAEWFDYLREEGVYDNTRIIIVSDHGYYQLQFEELKGGKIEHIEDGELLTSLLMFKDFGSAGFTVDDTFATSAETPYLATKDLIENPVNPYTGNSIRSELGAESQLVFVDIYDWDLTKNNGTKFLPGDWYTIYGDIWDSDGWVYEGKW